MEEHIKVDAYDGAAGAAAALRHIARDERIKTYVLQNPAL
jgi:hypothetical protein